MRRLEHSTSCYHGNNKLWREGHGQAHLILSWSKTVRVSVRLCCCVGNPFANLMASGTALYSVWYSILPLLTCVWLQISIVKYLIGRLNFQVVSSHDWWPTNISCCLATNFNSLQKSPCMWCYNYNFWYNVVDAICNLAKCNRHITQFYQVFLTFHSNLSGKGDVPGGRQILSVGHTMNIT